MPITLVTYLRYFLTKKTELAQRIDFPILIISIHNKYPFVPIVILNTFEIIFYCLVIYLFLCKVTLRMHRLQFKRHWRRKRPKAKRSGAESEFLYSVYLNLFKRKPHKMVKNSILNSVLYLPINYQLKFSSVNGKKIKPSGYEILNEVALICSLCNDSSITYNEVSKSLHVNIKIIH